MGEFVKIGCGAGPAIADYTTSTSRQKLPIGRDEKKLEGFSSGGDIARDDDFPIELLPEPLRVAAQEVARFSKVPVASPAVIALSVLATAIGKSAEIEERPGLRHHPAFFFVLIAPSGERKSPPFKLMAGPLEEWARDQQEAHEREVADALGMNAAIESRISILKKMANNAADLDDIATHIASLELKRRKLPPMPRPRGDPNEQQVQRAAPSGAFARSF